MDGTTADSYDFTLAIDPSTVSTAQQKKVSFLTKRIFPNPKVLRTKSLVARLASPHRDGVRRMFPEGGTIFLSVTFFYRYPTGTPKSRLVDGAAKGNGADCDNLAKAPIDALGNDKGKGAGLWDDDRSISTLLIRKRYTLGNPRIHVSVRRDSDPS